MFFFVFVSNFFSEVVGHLGDSRVILVKAGWIGVSWCGTVAGDAEKSLPQMRGDKKVGAH